MSTARTETSFASPDSGLSVDLGVFRRNPDLALVALLFLAIACGSRGLAQAIQVGPFYITEILMGLGGLIALIRLGVGRSWLALRRLPLIALAIIWLAGAYAAYRGFSDYTFSLVKNDIGLIDYSLVLPLFALVAFDRERYRGMFAALVACGFVGIVTFVVTFSVDNITNTADSLIALQGQAAGLYMSFAIVWIVARLVNGVPTPTWLVALAPIGLVLMSLTSQRSVLLIAVLSLGGVVLLAPRGRFVRSAVATGVVFAVTVVAAIGISAAVNSVLGGVEARTETSEVADGLGQGGLTQSNDTSPQLAREIGGLTGGGGGAEGDNVTWRLAYWKEILSRVPSDPIAGVGFGQPGDFLWNGRKYDFRDGDPVSGIDVAGPHNSFVSWVYRLGIPAALALLFVMFIAIRNAWVGGRDPDAELGERVTLATLLGMLGAGIGVSLFNESLTGPFLGLYFWAPLAMLLLWPAVGSREAEEQAAQ